VYLIDDDLRSRRSIAAQISAHGAEAWPFSSGAEFVEMIDRLKPSLVLLDMEMPGQSGFEVMAALSSLQLHWPVVAMSNECELSIAVEAMKRGALDFLRKPLDEALLEPALALAWSTLDKWIEAVEAQSEAQERLARLTAREVDVALALLSGKANKSVAYHLGISVRTVEMHRSHLLEKLGVRSLAEAALMVSQAGLDVAEAARSRPSLRCVGRSDETPIRAA
jgi:two-component system response regulator FixJ